MNYKNAIENEYFNWLCDLVCRGEFQRRRKKYEELLRSLHEKEFIYFLPMDANRYEDGIYLRYTFANETGIEQSEVACRIDVRPCSMLEMMAALSIRCEEDMLDRDNAASLIFWEMIDNLGLSDMEDGYFDSIRFNKTISVFLRRDYEPSGKGGLFTIRKKGKDMRLAEIWYQLCWYLNERSY